MHDGKKIKYFINGYIQAEKVYKEGKRNGIWVFKFENRNIQRVEEYIAGRKHGKWVSNYNSGRI